MPISRGPPRDISAEEWGKVNELLHLLPSGKSAQISAHRSNFWRCFAAIIIFPLVRWNPTASTSAMKSSVLLGAKGTGPNATRGKVDAEISPETEAAHREIVNVECQTTPGFPVINQHRWKCGKEVGLVISWVGNWRKTSYPMSLPGCLSLGRT